MNEVKELPLRAFTWWGTVLYVDIFTNELRHGPAAICPYNVRIVLDKSHATIMSDYSMDEQARVMPHMVEVNQINQRWTGLRAEGFFLCAEPDGRVTLSRKECREWEMFELRPARSVGPVSGSADHKTVRGSFPINADCAAANIVFCIWTNTNPMSSDRARALFSIFSNIDCPVSYLNFRSYRNWEVDSDPFHPSFEFLSATHKADYLRAYLMHHYGGGYTDIKHTSKPWRDFFYKLNSSDMFCLGYTEIGPHGVALVEDEILLSILRQNYRKLIGNGAYIFKKGTPLTKEWLKRTNALLDTKYDLLKKHPAKHPQDQRGLRLVDGSISEYPLRWAEMLGSIFHPLAYEHRDKIIHADIAPSFSDYR